MSNDVEHRPTRPGAHEPTARMGRNNNSNSNSNSNSKRIASGILRGSCVVALALGLTAACGSGTTATTASNPSTTATGASTASSSSAPASSTGSTPTAATAKVSANTASEAEITRALEAAGVTNAARWTKEVMEYRPYPADDPTLAKLKKELQKYKPSKETQDKILAALTP